MNNKNQGMPEVDKGIMQMLDDRIEAAFQSHKRLTELGNCARRYRVGNTLTLPNAKSIALTGGSK